MDDHRHVPAGAGCWNWTSRGASSCQMKSEEDKTVWFGWFLEQSSPQPLTSDLWCQQVFISTWASHNHRRKRNWSVKSAVYLEWYVCLLLFLMSWYWQGTHQWLFGTHGAVATVACFSVPRGSGAQGPGQKTGVVLAQLQVGFTLASYLVIWGHGPLLQALWTSELPHHSVLLQHVLQNRFALWTDPALRELRLQQHEVLLYSLQTFGEVKVNLLPWKLVFLGLPGSPVLPLDHCPCGHSERADGGAEQLLQVDGAQQPRWGETCDLTQGHFTGDQDESLLETSHGTGLSYWMIINNQYSVSLI